MHNQLKLCLWLTKVNTDFFSAVPKLPLIWQVGPSAKTKKLFSDYQFEMMKYYQHQTLQNF